MVGYLIELDTQQSAIARSYGLAQYFAHYVSLQLT